jgi:tRNA threonylcarbamoyladenosine biosynthesis protein TsaB
LAVYPDAAMMAKFAHQQYAAGQFVDVAYYEPHYLKEYVVGVSTKSLF